PWVDEVLRLGEAKPKPRMGGTKGSHILLPKFQGGPNHALYLPAHQDGRPFFIIPWRNYYWVGTTATTDIWIRFRRPRLNSSICCEK
ncbi:hypothetical protein GWO43_21900, partial [candidate division KSB1 bacterium]|nr:hypothetical protein [candidate division KSB1 bacterium]NIR72390.1 hypothetical protein [candidate division KSB1 bacterium]NIS26733.1 hypothetical protein [candidate division KSB1 bacterium]NIT73480.1 hypothetical protein [candidate division KSB1 bacterium]NIU27348.1 hypothetical protein [candidate division KSB1 bacterium]